MHRSLHGLWALAALGSPAMSASIQRPPTDNARHAGVISAFDRVPVAAERIASMFGVISSTFRTVAHNREVGGVPNSYHLRGRAIDIVRRPGVTHSQIAAALRGAGFVLIESLDEHDHSHFAFAPAEAALSASGRQAQLLTGPRVAADEHGSLLLDMVPERKLGMSTNSR